MAERETLTVERRPSFREAARTLRGRLSEQRARLQLAVGEPALVSSSVLPIFPKTLARLHAQAPDSYIGRLQRQLGEVTRDLGVLDVVEGAGVDYKPGANGGYDVSGIFPDLGSMRLMVQKDAKNRPQYEGQKGISVQNPDGTPMSREEAAGFSEKYMGVIAAVHAVGNETDQVH